MTPSRILVVEDDPAIAEILTYNLRDAGFEVDVESDGRSGLQVARAKPPELIILDLMLPTMDGTEVCRQLRADATTRGVLILMLTAKAEETDQVVGFAVGADDYVTKPFSVKVLVERVKALLRRKTTGQEDQQVLVSQGITIDHRRHIARAGDQTLDLTPSEFALLETLIRQPGRAYSRQDLIDAALGGDAIVLERTIDVHIRSLRKKLGAFAELIETVRGIGYRFRDSLSLQ
jgi:two-component system phosphate regulon response regulator PhoB